MSEIIRRFRERVNSRRQGQGEEAEFQKWYSFWSNKTGIDPDPDHPDHKYDYRAAFRAGATPTPDAKSGEYHWPSPYKHPDHPNRYVEGIDTITGQPMRGDYPSKKVR
jgi:hypothetical protein